MNEKKHVIIYTDGACSGNPGPGGWGAILQYGEHRLEMSGFEGHTTNNRIGVDITETIGRTKTRRSAAKATEPSIKSVTVLPI